MLESLFEHRSNKYELIFFDNIHSIKFSPFLLNLKNYIPKEHFEPYESGIATTSCVRDNKWVGLPINIDVTFLYYNDAYLNKYKKPVPKTWEELLKIGKYIQDQEKNNNNTDFLAYNGLFSRSEIGTCSLIEFIYSYRKSLKAPIPELQSEESIEALEMIKKIKNEIASDQFFQEMEVFSGSYINSGKFLFAKFWYMPLLIHYNFTNLPGREEGLSGSVIGGYNLGINKYTNDKHRDAAITAFRFITSKEMQKKLVLENQEIISAIPSIYEDEDVCLKYNCEVFKNLQLVTRPTDKFRDYDDYSEKYRDWIYEFLYGNKTAAEVLKKIDDLTKYIILKSIQKIHYLKFSSRLRFLSNDFWIISVVGSCIIMSSLYTELEKVTYSKCHIKPILLCIGYTLNLVPIACKLIVNFPEENKISVWVSKHRYSFLLIFLLIDLSENLLLYITPYEIEKNTNINGEIFQFSTFSFSNYLFLYAIKIIIYYIKDDKKEETQIILKIQEQFQNSTHSCQNSSDINSDFSMRSDKSNNTYRVSKVLETSTGLQKLLKFHNKEYI
ncbi:periplasmic binding protein-like II [Neocallimastix californiae]|uniref:Periplasmic binding protein-like II n=1 Tax=Neocallimastix californiae TaxID=1754190 RepID=A0A1Y2C366_9FUNG|nr:periplasmic binding protein-like II [Neocallimastix californiae]|eukprot:ORY41493.1 periplasmic binding protein-like II [Neocallimastix californiae]